MAGIGDQSYGTGKNLARMGEVFDAASSDSNSTQGKALQAFAKGIVRTFGAALGFTPDHPITQLEEGTFENTPENQKALLVALKEIVDNPKYSPYLVTHNHIEPLLKGLNFQTKINTGIELFTKSGGLGVKRLSGMINMGLIFLEKNPSQPLSLRNVQELKITPPPSTGSKLLSRIRAVFSKSAQAPDTAKTDIANVRHEVAIVTTPTPPKEPPLKEMHSGDVSLTPSGSSSASPMDALNVKGSIKISGKTYDVESMGHDRVLVNGTPTTRIRGRGTFGRVLIGVDRETGEKVAIKMARIPSRSSTSPDTLVKEAQLQLRLGECGSDRLMTAKDAAVLHEGGQTTVFTVMEPKEGGELHLTYKKMSMEERDQVLLDAAEGIGAMHKHGILHRDLKLENMLCSGTPPRGSVIDFGFALKLDSPRAKEKQVRGVSGTPGYMAPEIYLEKCASKAGDVFAFGAMAFRAWMKRPAISPPSEGETPASSVINHLSSIDWDDVKSKIGEPRARLLQDCLQYNRRLRPTMEEIQKRLTEIAHP